MEEYHFLDKKHEPKKKEEIMVDENIIVDIPKCWNCGHDETVSQKAWKFANPEDKDPPFTSANKAIVPLTASSTAVMMSLPSVPGAMIHTDHCAKCGAPRATRAEKTSIPGEVFRQMMGIRAPQQRTR